MRSSFYKALFSLLLGLSSLLGCAQTVRNSGDVQYYFTHTRLKNDAEKAKVVQLLQDINQEHSKAKTSGEALRDLYSGLKIKKLTDLKPEEYAGYRQYVPSAGEMKRVYFIVHPAYYVFFANTMPFVSKEDIQGFPTKNLVERFYETASYSGLDMNLEVMQEQERALRDFLEVMSAQKTLVILILPKDANKHFSYGYKDGIDEYVRYLNEITHGSESVLYLESTDYAFGTIDDQDMNTLSAFIKEMNANTLLLGGGFVGRCMNSFFESMEKKFQADTMFVIPEVTAIASVDIIDDDWNPLVKDGKLNFREIALNLKYEDSYTTFNLVRKRKSLFIYELSNSKLTLLNDLPRRKKKPSLKKQQSASSQTKEIDR
ncbi:MAG: hypothetical protein HZA15_10935 [Nitrospirae bacterium]|nr:hypothetical protein [Nitrospirota bacterium]